MGVVGQVSGQQSSSGVVKAGKEEESPRISDATLPKPTRSVPKDGLAVLSKWHSHAMARQALARLESMWEAAGDWRLGPGRHLEG